MTEQGENCLPAAVAEREAWEWKGAAQTVVQLHQPPTPVPSCRVMCAAAAVAVAVAESLEVQDSLPRPTGTRSRPRHLTNSVSATSWPEQSSGWLR